MLNTELYYENREEVRTLKSERDKWVSTAQALYEAQVELKRIEKLAHKLKEELKAMSSYKPMYLDGFMLSVEYRVGSVDYQAIPELAAIDLDQYRKEDVAVWKLSKVE
jgi:hypothetical protein